MSAKLPRVVVTDAELAVLQTLWKNGPSTIRQLVDLLYPEGKASQYGTVQKLLERLEAKGCVIRDRTPWPHLFHSTIQRDTMIGWQLRETAEKLCGGSMKPLLLHLLQLDQYSSDERRELRSFLERLSRHAGWSDANSTGFPNRGVRSSRSTRKEPSDFS